MALRHVEHIHSTKVVMGANTAIEWCDATFNPWWGCTRVSPACDHCYAAAWAHRLGMDELWDSTKRRTFGAEHWALPIRWNRSAERQGKRLRVFCASMADVFDKDAPSHERENLWDIIEDTPHLDWLLLTKRIANAERMLPAGWLQDPRPNVWLGATVVTQEEADRDVPKLLRIPAAFRFLSCEPLLELISLDHEWLVGEYFGHSEDCHDDLCALNGDFYSCAGQLFETPAVHWVIVGGESGREAREMNPDWARYLREQCQSTGAAFFMKQMTKKAEIPADLLVREFPNAPTSGGSHGT